MDSVIHQSTRLACSRDRAWELFTVSGELESWLTTSAEVEPRIGGKYELFWNPADRENDSTIGCRVTALSPGELIAFEWKGASQHKTFMNDVRPLTHVTVSIIPVDDEATDVHLVHSGWRDGAEWDEARQWFEQAWASAFEALQERAAIVPTG